MRVEGAGAVHAGASGDDRLGTDLFGMIENGVAVVGAVCEDVARRQAFEQRQCVGSVVCLAAGKQEAQRPPAPVDGDVPLACQPSSGTPQSLVLDPPFWPVAAWA
jgi:hypothetical protein